MSMLAEPRRRQKWSLNPRGTLWSNDDDKIGQKLLEKMGWSKGKGLGKNEDGNPEHLKVGYKSDSKGIGFKGSDDNWIAHQDDFGDLLSQLNDEHSTTKPGVSDGKEKDSLEIRSKKSRKRLHYHKFTRGKDLSQYSSEDISSILGKRKKRNAVKVKIEPDLPVKEVEFEESAPLKTSSMSVADYFKTKMEENLKKSKLQNVPKNCDNENTCEANEKLDENKPIDGSSEIPSAELNNESSSQSEKPVSKKKKKKRKRTD